MSVFWLQGKVDKRILAYPLIYACMIDGRTLVISDDGCFKHLYKQSGICGGNEYVTYCIDPELKIPSEIRPKEYTHIVYVSADDMDIKYDCCIRCIENPKDFLSENPYFDETPLQEQEYRVLLAPEDRSWNRPKDKRKIGIPVHITGERLLYAATCEEAKELLPVKDKVIRGVIAHVACNALYMQESQVAKLLRRTVVQLKEKEAWK